MHYKDIEILIFGSGGEEFYLKTTIADQKITNIKLFPLQPLEKVKNVYSLGDAGFVLCKKGFGKSAMPSKTWSIMATGRPILASFDLDGELSELITDKKCGYCSEPDNALGLVSNIEKLYHNRFTETVSMGNNARKCVCTECEKDICCKKYIDLFKGFNV